MNRNRQYAANRIREVRKALGVTLEELAARMPRDVSHATINKLEAGGMGFTLDWMQDIAKALGVDVGDLIWPPKQSSRTVPLIGSIAAGNWREAIEDATGEEVVPGDVGGPHTFALKVEGDSMDKVAPDGSIVTCDPDDRDLIDKKLYAVANEAGDATFKRYFASPARLEPVSTNPEHPIIRIGAEPFTVIGRITYAALDLR